MFIFLSLIDKQAPVGLHHTGAFRGQKEYKFAVVGGFCDYTPSGIKLKSLSAVSGPEFPSWTA